MPHEYINGYIPASTLDVANMTAEANLPKEKLAVATIRMNRVEYEALRNKAWGNKQSINVYVMGLIRADAK